MINFLITILCVANFFLLCTVLRFDRVEGDKDKKRGLGFIAIVFVFNIAFLMRGVIQ